MKRSLLAGPHTVKALPLLYCRQVVPANGTGPEEPASPSDTVQNCPGWVGS